MRLNRVVSLCLSLLLLAAVPTSAQDFRGRINGTVTDNTGAVLPGVTVTASSPALIQPQVQVTGAAGEYRFVALPPGVYDITFELTGFQAIKREGIRVVINQTLTVDQQLQVATLQETVTVSGASPVVDTSSTGVGTNFTKELLTDIPNARDIWAALSQAPGISMQAYDVGGSHAGTQTGYITYGVNVQNQTKIEGIDTTEGTSANAGYFDFGSFEELSVGGAGNNAENFASGAALAITVKSGGDRFSGNWYSDYENGSTISDNVPDDFRTGNTRDEDGFFVRTPLARGNPIDRQYDINFNVGGPLWKRRAWMFYSYRLDDQYKFVLNYPDLARSKLTNDYTFKGTFQLNRNNQIIGFLNKRNKLQDKRDIGPTTPLSASRYQASRNYPMKVEWTSVLGSRMFLDVLWGRWENFFPLRPQNETGIYTGTFVPGRIDTSNNQRFDGGGHDSYQNQKRFKPQFYASMSYFKDGWAGTHDFKFGYDWKNDRREFFQDQPFDLFYRDLNNAINQIDLYNSPTAPINEVKYHSGWITDNWKVNNRLTLNLGGRVEHYSDGWPEQIVAPNGHPQLAGWTEPNYVALIARRTVEARTVATTTTFSPRLGFAYDLSGDNRTVLKVFWGQFRFNSADTVADQENPVGRQRLRYQWQDLNGNRLLDGPGEIVRFVQSVDAGAGLVTVDRNIKRPTSNELSATLEREVIPGLSGRATYVYKNLRNVWGVVDLARAPTYTVPFTFIDPGPDSVRGTSDDQTLNLLDRPANVPEQRVYTNPSDPANNADFHNVEFAVNRRFAGKWMLLAGFGYSWLNQIHDMVSPTGATAIAGNGRIPGDVDFYYRPSQRLFGEDGRETTSGFGFKLTGRYIMPYDIGVSGSYRLQAGSQWGRTVSIPFPGDGTQNIRVESVTSHRAPNVSLLDFRFDKGVKFGRYGKLTGMVDIFNALNSGVVTNFRTSTGTAVVAGQTISTFQEVIALLDPRIVRFGLRYDF
jgi:Carboxypeptidase regulatory-like domain